MRSRSLSRNHLTAAVAALAAACATAPRAGKPLAALGSRPSANTAAGTLPPLYDRGRFFATDADVRVIRLSPDGRFVTFHKRANGVINIWAVRAGLPLDSGRPITASPRSLPGHQWSADGRYVLFRRDSAGDQRYRIYAVDPAAPPAPGSTVPPVRDLTPVPGARTFFLAFPERTPETILISLATPQRPAPDVYRLNVRTGERVLVYRSDQRVGAWTADMAGNLRLAQRQRSDGVWEVLALEGDSLRPIYACAPSETCVPERFHPDGRRVYLRTNRGDADLTRLVLLDVQTGAEQVVAEDPAREVDLGDVVFSSATGELAAASFAGGTWRRIAYDALLARDLARVRQQMPGDDVSPVASARGDRLWLVNVLSTTDRAGYYLYDRQAGTMTLLYRWPTLLPREHLPEWRAVQYRARDGLVIPAYLTLPRGVTPRRLPTVVVVHGGPWARLYPGLDPWAAFLANRGYAVLLPQFRGSAGFGKRFLNLGNREWGGRMQDDVTDGVRWVVAEGIADSARVAIVGESYGGYSALAGLAFTPQLYRAGVAFYGQTDLVAFVEAQQPAWALQMPALRAQVGDLEDPADRARLIRRSPLMAADRIRAPLLIAHGANDPLVDRSQSDRLVARLRQLGRDVEYLVASGEGHGFGQTVNQLAVWAAVERFLARQLGGRYQAELPPEVARRLEELRAAPTTLVAPPPGGRP